MTIVGIREGIVFENTYILPQIDVLNNGGSIIVDLIREGINNGTGDLFRDGSRGGKKISYLCDKYNIEKIYTHGLITQVRISLK
ncbi:hypothetical protein [Helicobacter sp. 23-1046]